MIAGLAWAWLSYAALFATRRAPGGRTHRRRVPGALLACAAFGLSASALTDVEPGPGGLILAGLAWTAAASALPLAATSRRGLQASLALAGLAAALGTLERAWR